MKASPFGVSGVVLSAGGGFETIGDTSWTAETNVYSGGGMELGLGHPGGLYVEGGRVTLRDAIDIRDWGGSTSEYWMTFAGLAIRF